MTILSYLALSYPTSYIYRTAEPQSRNFIIRGLHTWFHLPINALSVYVMSVSVFHQWYYEKSRKSPTLRDSTFQIHVTSGPAAVMPKHEKKIRAI